MIIRILICLALLIIVVQDFRFRAVHWILFPALWILLVADSLINLNFRDYVLGTSINLLIILFQGVILYAYYSLQGKPLSVIVTRIIGTGDILFIILMAFAFSWTSFMFFYITGLLFALLLWIFIMSISRDKNRLVPLAGLLALYMIIIMILDMILPEYGRSLDIMNIIIAYGS